MINAPGVVDRRHRSGWRGVRTALTVGLATAGLTAAAGAQAPERPEVPSRDNETEMALSAAPEALRAGAGVYVLEQQGYVLARPSRNGFTCIVNRDHPRAKKPTCFDAEGTRTIVPKILRVGELLMQGVPLAEIQRDVAADFAAGRLVSPGRAGVAYMMSQDNWNVLPNGSLSRFPPHVMFYAPNLTNADIGASRGQDRHLPFIAYQGPQGYMIMILPDSGGG